MQQPPIHRHNPTALWSDAVIHQGTAYFVEIPESGESFAEQLSALLAQTERTLAAIGSDKSRLLLATIYLPDMAHRAELNERWGQWLPEGCAPARICVKAELASPDWLIEIAFTVACS